MELIAVASWPVVATCRVNLCPSDLRRRDEVTTSPGPIDPAVLERLMPGGSTRLRVVT